MVVVVVVVVAAAAAVAVSVCSVNSQNKYGTGEVITTFPEITKSKWHA